MSIKILSQSSLKDFERADGCPLLWKHRWVVNDIPRPDPSMEMSYGHFFETLCIGSGAHGAVVEDLPRVKGDKKSAIHTRIEHQAEVFKRYFDKYDELFLGYTITDTQVEVADKNRKGVIDILAEKDGEVTIIDLKATSDVTNTYGSYAWGNPSNMDFIQQILYEDLYKYQTGIEVVKSLLLVFDWSPKMGRKLIELDISDTTREYALARFDESEELANEYEDTYWPTFPSRKECEGCPLVCKDRFDEYAIEREFITI